MSLPAQNAHHEQEQSIVKEHNSVPFNEGPSFNEKKTRYVDVEKASGQSFRLKICGGEKSIPLDRL